MATVKKSKTKKIVIPICLLLVIAIIATTVVIANKNKGIETVSLTTIATDSITETVSATGEITSGGIKEYKAGTVANCKEVFVKVGDKVKKGDILATFDTQALDSQISSLQSTYTSAAKGYSDALASQKTANAKLATINKQIPKLEKQLANAKKEAATSTTAKQTTRHTTTKVTTTKVATTNQIVVPTYTTTLPQAADTEYEPTIGGMVDALSDIVKTINELAASVEAANAATEIVMSVIAQEIATGNYDPDAIAEAVGAAVTEAIEQGMVEFVDSGAAVEMIKATVSSVDWAGIGAGIAETNGVQTASLEVQLAALYAQKELFTVQADPSVVNAQKQLRDSSKQALDTMKASQQELQVGWVATMSGIITECNVVAGAQTTMLETGIKLENQKSMTVTISLGEYDVHKVKVGMPAEIKTAYGKYTGEVATIAPTATGGSQGSILDSVGSMAGISGLSSLTSSGAGVQCTVTVNDPDEYIIAGFDAKVVIQAGEHDAIPVVPIESIVLEKEGTYVYLYDEEEETATKTKIETGAISDSAYEIKSGISIGDQIIATPGTYEEDTFKVKIATKK